MPSDDAYYNAQVTDASGNEMGVRVDLLQPDVWLLNGLDIVDCSVLQTFYQHHSDASVSSISYASRQWGASVCHLAGAYTPVEVVTTVEKSETTILTETTDPASTMPSSVVYPNGIWAEGVLQTANLSIGTTTNNRIDLDEIQFFLASGTNVYAGGLGLSKHPQNLGLLDTLKDQGRILSSSYSLFLSGYANLNSTAGELLLGAVDQKYYSGPLYLFPLIPYERWGSPDTFAPLPILVLEKLFLENIDTHQKVTLSGDQPIPLVLDTRISYSFLPLEIIINLAIQTNAYYNSQYQRWLVRCLDITGSNATMHFQFGPLDIAVPLTSLIYDAYYDDNYLYFSSGVRACFLNVMPDSSAGYSSLGLPFLSHVYLAMDNEAGNVAMAKGNPGEQVDSEQFDFSESASPLPSFTVSLAANRSVATADTTIAYIQSGFIPFATSANYSSSGFTMTFFSANSSGGGTVPGRFTVATILSGEIYVTGADGSTVSGSRASGSASAANARTLSSRGMSVKSYVVSQEASYLPYVLLFGGTIMAILMA